MEHITRRLFAVCALLLIARPLPAQQHTVVKADRVLIDEQFVPRFLDLPKVKAIARGEVWEPPTDSTWDYIEVQDGGVLLISRTHNTTLRFTHLFILPGGYLNAGVAGHPGVPDSVIPDGVKVEFVVRDVPIDTTRDPFQWGNGLLNFGRQDRCGAPKVAWTMLTGSLPAGASSVTLVEDPVGWHVGDELLFPDMTYSARRETAVFIAGIDGRTIALSKPLDFAHNDILRPDGPLLLHPRVANLTRNVIIRSEGLNTPGHAADVGHDASWGVCNTAFVDLGRTRNVRLDDTSADLSHIGTNPRARYADHHHHAMGYGSFTTGNILRGSGIGKWGEVVHATHDVRVENNIAIGFTGSGFVTEDGYETRTVFRRNLAAFNLGNHKGELHREVMNDDDQNPGAAGDGFWFRSRFLATIVGNEAWNNFIGFNDFGIKQVQALYPRVAGGVADTPFDRTQSVPADLRDNVTAGNRVTGFEYWGDPKYPNRNLISANNGKVHVLQGQNSPSRPYLVNPQLVGENGEAIGLMCDVAYVYTLDVEGGYIGGNSYGLAGGGGYKSVIFKDVTMQNVINLSLSGVPRYFHQTNVMHKPFGARPMKYIEFGNREHIWSGVGPTPRAGIPVWVPQLGSQWGITNWQGTGKDYQLFSYQMQASLPAWPSTVENGRDDEHIYDCPEAGLTNLECWNKYGMSISGDVIRDEEIVPLEGLLTGFAREGSQTLLGPPRAVVTSPTLRHDATVAFRKGYVGTSLRIQIQLTGDGSRYQSVKARVDGGDWQVVQVTDTDFPTVRFFAVGGDAVKPGVHTVETVRVDSKNAMTTPLTFYYRVGDSESQLYRLR